MTVGGLINDENTTPEDLVKLLSGPLFKEANIHIPGMLFKYCFSRYCYNRLDIRSSYRLMTEFSTIFYDAIFFQLYPILGIGDSVSYSPVY